VYDIKDTVVIPKGTSLTIEAGAKLQFRAGRSLISYSPIIAEGTPDAPILFSAKNKLLKWGAVGLVGTGPSLFAHVIFENGRQSFINELDFLGALSFINSDALIRDSKFTNLYGKDGVYVREGRVVVQNNLFKDTYKDCLDFNSGEGEITNNQFINCGDEGIDLSQNINVQVFDNLVLDPQGDFIGADFNLEEIQALNSLGFSEDD
jgi:hypothetical protein